VRKVEKIEERIEAFEARDGGSCPKCTGGGGPDRGVLVVIRNAASGKFVSARLGGKEITEEEITKKCPGCGLSLDDQKRPEITIGGSCARGEEENGVSRRSSLQRERGEPAN